MSGQLLNADLPDDILVEEITRLPLVEQVRIGDTSPRFHHLMTRALALVDSLTVVLDYDNEYQRLHNWFGDTLSQELGGYIRLDGMAEADSDALLGYRRIDERATLVYSNDGQVNLAWLTSSMPNVRKLVYMQNGGNVGQVTSLLDAWSSTLTSLTLLYHPDVFFMMPTEQSTRLFDSINGLAHLQDLFVEFMHYFEASRLDLPILGQLCRFQFYSKDESNELLLTSLRQYVPNNRELRQILLGKATCLAIGRYLPDFLPLDQRITSKVTGLLNYGDDCALDGPMIDLLCSKFVSLTYLKLSVVSPVYTPAQLVNALSSLTQLYYLDLNLSGASNMRISAQEANRDDKAIAGGPRLASIQVLVVECGESYNHRDLSHIYDWAFTFPGLRVVKVIDMKFVECARCRVQKLRPGQALTPGFTQVDQRPLDCIQRLTSTLQRCPLICMLMLKYPDLDDTYGEFSVNHLINREILYH